MYVPSDFCLADHSWMKSFPVHDGFKIQYASTFHIFNKDLVESPLLSDAIYDPTDADHSFNAKVMLLAVPPPNVLIEKTCQLAESSKYFFFTKVVRLKRRVVSGASHECLRGV